jgi:hypothetical protein
MKALANNAVPAHEECMIRELLDHPRIQQLSSAAPAAGQEVGEALDQSGPPKHCLKQCVLPGNQHRSMLPCSIRLQGRLPGVKYWLNDLVAGY